jgi:hypothetical protein
MKSPIIFAAALAAGMLCANDAVIFHVNFDGNNIDPVIAKGTKLSANGSKIGFDTKKVTGFNGKGGAIKLDKTLAAKWYVNNNFKQKGGTVSLWISPVDWQVADKSEHLFFQANMRDFDLRLMRDKNSDERIIFRITAAGFPGKNKTYFATASIADWQPGTWHKVDLVWNESFMRIYVDGKLQSYSPQRNGKGAVYSTTKLPSGTAFPDKTLYGGISLNVPRPVNAAEQTAFDELKIRDRVLNADEIAAVYKQERSE